MADTPLDLQTSIAVTRFAMGARPGELASVGRDARGWLEAQIEAGAPRLEGDHPTTADALTNLDAYNEASRRAREMAAADGSDPTDARREARGELRDHTTDEFHARARLAATTPHGFSERWTLFWANWFTVAIQKLQVSALVGPFERDVIRRHAFGGFEDMLLAAERHPAMLYYLDQAASRGPNSDYADRRGGGLNENLAREILELHSLGSDGGYSQADVTEFAKALTGWSADRTEPVAEDGFMFRPSFHEPGDRVVMGKTYASARPGDRQGQAILRDLARHPSTARHAARRIARHFVADDPPARLVQSLETAWRRSDGDLAAVARALIAAPEAWAVDQRKIKTPYDFMISAYRAADETPRLVSHIQQPLIQLGQRAWSAPAPDGWPDEGAAWATPDGLVKRLSIAQQLAERAAPDGDPVQRAESVLGARLQDDTRTAIARAQDREDAFALLVMSPEFQRR